MAPTLRDAFARCLFTAAFLFTWAAVPGKAAPVKAQHLEAELIAEPAAAEPGKAFTAGLRLKLEPHWHVYWKNPGDAGLPVSIEWSLPKGWSAGPIQWPVPERIAVAPLMNYGYEGEVLLPVEITPPSGAAASGTVELNAKGKWIVCKEICLPGSADLVLSLPFAAAGKAPRTGDDPAADPARADLFRRARADLPAPAARLPWKFSAVAGDSHITLLAVPPAGAEVHPGFLFFPEEQEIIENAAAQSFYRTAQGYALDLARIPPDPEEAAAAPDSLIGLVVSPGGWNGDPDFRGVEVRIPLARGAKPAAVGPAVALGAVAPPEEGSAAGAIGGFPEGSGSIGNAGATSPEAPAGFGKLLFMLSFAFLGGLILNLMPCVLPVLSLKIFDFVKRSGESRLKVFSHGLVFTSGVLVSFWLLAGLLLVLRQGGAELGWGFQLQSPSFLMVLCALFFFFSLNLFGVFELGYLFTRIGSGQGQEGHMGSFVAGVTATVVATPCTAPFMGSAMGYAFSQPPQYALLVFTFLGLGMSSPYLILAGFPALMRFLPKPGEWMEHLKQFMGFPLLGTAIWLAWVLGKQAGVDALVALLFVLLLAGLSAWILGKWTALHRTTPVRVIAGILALVIFLPAFILVLMFVDQQRGITGPRAAAGTAALGGPEAPGGIPWEDFSPARLEGLLAEGKPVFIDFTADWCLSCKVNERVTLARPEVAGRFRELGLTALKADWTLHDETIARALARYGRNSIPLYVLHTGNGDEHVILPEIITPAMVLEALKKLELPATTRR